jgi:hypothetical protein
MCNCFRQSRWPPALDFLPFDCPGCQQSFCQAHRTPQEHECPSLEAQARSLPSKPKAPVPLVPALGVSEASGDTSKAKDKNAKAKALLAKNFPSNPATPTVKPPVKAKAQSPALRMMLLRQKATNADPKKRAGDVPLEERIHFYLVHDSNSSASAKPYWLNKVRSSFLGSRGANRPRRIVPLAVLWTCLLLNAASKT